MMFAPTIVLALVVSQATLVPVAAPATIGPPPTIAPGCLVTSPPPPTSEAVIHAFRKTHPCPATGKTLGACPGYEVHHIIPRCCIGTAADVPQNLTWVTVLWHDEIHRRIVCKGAKP